MEFVKQLFQVRKDLKKKAIVIANSRQNNDLPDSTLKSVLNEALEIGLKSLEQSKSSKKEVVFS